MTSLPWWALLAGLVTLAISAGGGLGAADRRPLVAAHRGGAALWPENSLLAFRQALALGVDLLECDVHLTADGEVVVIHDATLDRTTTGRGAVGDLPLAEVVAARLRGPDGAVTDQHVPTLRQLLDLLAPGPAGLLLEIKLGPRRQPYPAIEEKVLAVLGASGLAVRTLVMAFEPDTVRRVRELDPAIRTALLVGERGSGPEALRQARRLGAAALGIDYRLVDQDLVAAARAGHTVLGAWTVNAAPDLARLVDLGVDVVISDRPDLALIAAGRPPAGTGSR